MSGPVIILRLLKNDIAIYLSAAERIGQMVENISFFDDNYKADNGNKGSVRNFL